MKLKMVVILLGLNASNFYASCCKKSSEEIPKKTEASKDQFSPSLLYGEWIFNTLVAGADINQAKQALIEFITAYQNQRYSTDSDSSSDSDELTKNQTN